MAPLADLLDAVALQLRICRWPNSALARAAKAGNLPAVAGALRAGADVASCGPKHGRSALHWAAERGHAHVCSLLVCYDGDTQARDAHGFTPLELACVGNHRGAVAVLHTADPRGASEAAGLVGVTDATRAQLGQPPRQRGFSGERTREAQESPPSFGVCPHGRQAAPAATRLGAPEAEAQWPEALVLHVTLPRVRELSQVRLTVLPECQSIELQAASYEAPLLQRLPYPCNALFVRRRLNAASHQLFVTLLVLPEPRLLPEEEAPAPTPAATLPPPPYESLPALDSADTQEAMPAPPGSECVICLSAARDTALVPCGHLVLCHPCAGTLLSLPQPRCPVCRAQPRLRMRVYL